MRTAANNFLKVLEQWPSCGEMESTRRHAGNNALQKKPEFTHQSTLFAQRQGLGVIEILNDYSDTKRR